MDEANVPYKIVEEPGVLVKGKYIYYGTKRMLQPCDEDQNPVEGERLMASFIPKTMRVRDRSRYEPHQGTEECRRRFLAPRHPLDQYLLE